MYGGKLGLDTCWYVLVLRRIMRRTQVAVSRFFDTCVDTRVVTHNYEM